MQYKLLSALKSINWKDVAVRASWTFLQAFLAVFIIAGESILDLLFSGDWTGLWTLVVATSLAGVAAGLSALKTILVSFVKGLKA